MLCLILVRVRALNATVKTMISVGTAPLKIQRCGACSISRGDRRRRTPSSMDSRIACMPMYATEARRRRTAHIKMKVKTSPVRTRSCLKPSFFLELTEPACSAETRGHTSQDPILARNAMTQHDRRVSNFSGSLVLGNLKPAKASGSAGTFATSSMRASTGSFDLLSVNSAPLS